MNKSIAFTNFRRFTNFPKMELGDITVLVGGNNAGKSTLVKAMLLMRDFILSEVENTKVLPEFNFDTEHVSIGNFRRAFCRNSGEKDAIITFSLGIDQFEIKVDVRGDRLSDLRSRVIHIKITDTANNVDFIFDFVVNRMSVRFGINDKKEENIVALKDRLEEFQVLKSLLNESKNLEEITQLKDKIEYISKAIKSLQEDYDRKEDIVTIDIPDNRYDNTGWFLLPELINLFVDYSYTATMGDKRSTQYKKEEAYKNALKARKVLIQDISRELEETIRRISIEYIYAHSVNQQVFYNKERDSNDYVTRTIHEFYQSKIVEGDDEYSFIKKWMDIFDIGNAVEVLSYEGEAFRVIVYNEENKNGIDLADMGMGSIQTTILLLRIATLARRYKSNDLTILLEEPEQNLHPALQSKLADLLYDVNKSYGFQIIVETHSEYMVRHIQVLSAKFFKKGTDETPFKVFYITGKDEHPYDDMGFQKNGKFENEFGPGFFNVADDEAMELFDLDDDE